MALPQDRKFYAYPFFSDFVWDFFGSFKFRKSSLLFKVCYCFFSWENWFSFRNFRVREGFLNT